MGSPRRLLLLFLILTCTAYFFLLALQWLPPSTLAAPALVDDSAAATADIDCPLGHFFVYDLPPEFNLDITRNCSTLNPWTDYCAQLSNGGHGLALAPELAPLPSLAGSWFATDQFTLEPIFHARALAHPCRTRNPARATAFYVPFYAGLDVGRHLWLQDVNRTDYLGLRLLSWLSWQPQWLRHGGWDHFLAVGRGTWDFRRQPEFGATWGSSFFHTGAVPNTTRLLVERHTGDESEVGVPFPTGFRPNNEAEMRTWQNHIAGRGTRTHLFVFAGAPRAHIVGDFRGILAEQCTGSKRCRQLHCKGNRNPCRSNPKAVLDLFLDSDFCLQPRGDSFTRRSTFDCMLAGCIPVFFWERTAYGQYTWHLPENRSSYSVFMPRKAVRQGMVIEEALKNYSQGDVAKMRETIIDMLPRLVYAASSEGFKDAFDVSIDGILRRFKT